MSIKREYFCNCNFHFNDVAQVTQEMLLQYVHFNRHYNTLLIQHNRELIDQLKTAVDSLLPGGEFVTVSTAGALVYTTDEGI